MTFMEIFNCDTQQMEWKDIDESEMEELPPIGNCFECLGYGTDICGDKPCAYCGGSGNIWWAELSVTLPNKIEVSDGS